MYIATSFFVAAGSTSSDQSQQATNIMSQSMKLLNQMGTGSQPSASDVTEHSGSFYLPALTGLAFSAGP